MNLPRPVNNNTVAPLHEPPKSLASKHLTNMHFILEKIKMHQNASRDEATGGHLGRVPVREQQESASSLSRLHASFCIDPGVNKSTSLSTATLMSNSAQVVLRHCCA